MQHLPVLYWTGKNDSTISLTTIVTQTEDIIFFILLVQSYDHTCIEKCINNGNWIRRNFNNFDFHRLQQSHMEPGIASDMLRNLQTHVYEVKTLHGCRDSTVIARKRHISKTYRKKDAMISKKAYKIEKYRIPCRDSCTWVWI